VSVLLGDGLGGFGAATSYPAGGRPRGIAAGDFNGDGRVDLAVTANTGRAVAVLLNRGAGAYDAPALTGGAGTDRFSGGPGADAATDLTPAEGDTQEGTIP
jgi:hypothetical protein